MYVTNSDQTVWCGSISYKGGGKDALKVDNYRGVTISSVISQVAILWDPNILPHHESRMPSSPRRRSLHDTCERGVLSTCV